MNKILSVFVLILAEYAGYAQSDSIGQVSAVHPNVYYDFNEQVYFLKFDTMRVYEGLIPPKYSLDQMINSVSGTHTGLFFDFKDESLNGKLIYGFIPMGDSKHPHPVYFRIPAKIMQGKVAINIAQVLKGTYDMIGWEKSGKGTMGYRVVNEDGRILYDGKVSFKGTGPFEVDVTLVEGPFINLIEPDGATISFDINIPVSSEILVDGKTFKSESEATHHEIKVSGLNADTEYNYTVKYGDITDIYYFRTAPEAGSRSAFTFAYASDSRAGNGSGERDIYGTNFYIMKKIMALATFKNIRFMQFTGDMINGYLTSRGDMELQYANWKRAIDPFARYFPVFVSMGNHEAFMRIFVNDKSRFDLDRFPYDTESAEALFASQFVNPLNGPDSEDGASYDPRPEELDFPSYKENVFYYTYDNVAVIALNSDYWYAPTTANIPITSGGMHGYIMDNQMKWLKKTIKGLEKNNNIDHIFITEHTPFFPNGGHVRDDMWYDGNNDKRPWVAGKPLKKGIIERRDELLDIIVNQSTKVVAILTGDEHNYCRTEIGPETPIYDDNWTGKRLTLKRTIYQINNGAAGAPYYAQEQTPWTSFTSSFTTQNALVFFHVNGEKIKMEVLNPDTLETVDEMDLR